MTENASKRLNRCNFLWIHKIWKVKCNLLYHFNFIFFLQDKNQTEIQSVKKESEQSQKQFLQRLFPEVKAPKVSKSHSDWLEDFACQVNKYKDVNKQLKEASPVKAEVDQEQINKLEGQVQHYQSVLNATVSVELKRISNN